MIGYANIEWCIWAAIQTSGSGGSFKIQAACLDIEVGGSSNPSGFNGPSHVIDDTGNKAWGYIGIRSASDPYVAASRVIGGANLELVDLGVNTGAITAPSVPASGAAIIGAWRNSYVAISGSSITDVKVSGQTVPGLSGTLAGAAVLVPSGRTIQIDYTATAPTWSWWTL
jgi:hypothetical protein